MPLLDHRVAIVLLSAAILAAGAPLAAAWASLLPAEREPFLSAGEDAPARKRNALAIVLLLLTTLSYLVRLPGVPLEATLLRLDAKLLPPWPEYVLLGATVFFVLIPALTAVYALFRPGALRNALLWAGILVLVFWLASPYLTASLLEN